MAFFDTQGRPAGHVGEYLRLLEEKPPEMRVVLSSGIDRTGVLEELLREEPWAFLQKPFKAHDLVPVIGQAVRE